MLKCEIINTCEGNGIIERIEGNGWDIDADHIELNGINAHIVEELECRCIFLDGPAVEDLFKNLSDLLKENGKLRTEVNNMKKENTGLRNYIDEMKKSDESVNYCANDVLAIETLHLRQIIEEQDKGINRLKKDLKEKEAIIKEKKDRIKTLNREVRDKDIEIERLNNSLSNYYELYEKCRVLENKLKLADKWNPIKDFIREKTGDDVIFAIKSFPHFIPDYVINVSVSKQEYDDIEIDKHEKYDSTKEIIRWLDGEIKNNTDYATKIFNKENKENIFSITFCKVPVEPEVVTNEQD